MPSAAKPKYKPTTKLIRLDFEAIGTQWMIEFDIPSINIESRTKDIAKQIADRTSEFDQNYSRFRTDSWITKASHNQGAHRAPADFAPMFELYQRMYTATYGAVTPLIGDAMERAGYNAQYSLVPKPLLTIPKLEETLDFQDNTLLVKYKCMIDLGAVGKGFLVDQVALLLENNGIYRYIINAGGDIRVASPVPSKSTPVITVALENPADTSKSIGEARLGRSLQGLSICGSAGNRRKWADFHHIINPKTLRPVNEIVATWVVAGSALLADGLSTCLFFADPADLAAAFDFEYIRIMADNTKQISPGFPGRVYEAL